MFYIKLIFLDFGYMCYIKKFEEDGKDIKIAYTTNSREALNFKDQKLARAVANYIQEHYQKENEKVAVGVCMRRKKL